MGIGIYALVSKDSVAAYLPGSFPLKAGIGILIFVGSVVFVAGFFGCCGAIKENKCLLMSFFLVILIIFIFEITGVILMYVYYPKVQTEVIKIINEGDEFDYVETSLKCCGYNGPEDYKNSTVPASCYKGGNAGSDADLYKNGCKDTLLRYFWYIGGIGIFILFVELLAMISAIALFRGVDDYEATA